jgi:uncharacterized membrane-anchored protein YitT (DUF2179 family)
MKEFNKIKAATNDYLLDHPRTKNWTNWSWKFIVEAISGLIFAFGFRAFIAPSSPCVSYWTNGAITTPNHLISGGASGLSQAILKFVMIFTDVPDTGNNFASFNQSLFISILYFVLNIPLFILAWKKISKQFTVFTIFNVLFVSMFNYIIPDSWIYNVVNIYDDLLARAIFGGITTGLSSGLAMIIGTSGGGSDIITVYISEKKSTTVGKYSLIVNTIIVLTYVFFAVIGINVSPAWNTQTSNEIITMALYTVIYFFVSSKVIDLLNIKNRKQELQIFTSNENLAQVMIHAFPHSCTIVESKGAYSGKKNMMVYMVVSKSEQKRAIDIVRSVDKFAFVTVTDINQVYGQFYIKPFE